MELHPAIVHAAIVEGHSSLLSLGSQRTCCVYLAFPVSAQGLLHEPAVLPRIQLMVGGSGAEPVCCLDSYKGSPQRPCFALYGSIL